MADSWHAQSVDSLLDELESDAERGLSPDAASRRLTEQGPNELSAKEGPGVLRQFFRQFADITVLALVAAAGVAVLLAVFEKSADASLLERFGDAIAITAIVILNAVIGFVQERKAEHALSALKDMTAPSACVVRGNEEQSIPAVQVVPGDVVLLDEGDRVPADLRLTSSTDLAVTEAALTGESTPVEKDTTEPLGPDTDLAERRNMVFLGTHVTTGHARGVVVATGMGTELGRIAGMLGEVETPDTPLQRDLQRFGTYVVIGCVVVGAIVFGIGIWRLDASVGFLLLTAVSLAVAAIPEGLPAITTIVLALGVQRMAKKNALVRRLSAVETLGAAHVICTDKTGTLTQNRMVVRRLWAAGRTTNVEGDMPLSEPSGPAGGREPKLVDDTSGEEEPAGEDHAALSELIVSSRFAPAARVVEEEGERRVRGDPTDAALLALHDAHAKSRGHDAEVQRELPFDGDRKMATVIVQVEGKLLGYSHGAPEQVLDHVVNVAGDDAERPFGEQDRQALAKLIDSWASDGLRVLAIARSRPKSGELSQDRGELIEQFERELTLVGLVGIADPPRPEAAEAVRVARSAGLVTVMITGDHPLTARAIGREIGLLDADDEVVTGQELDRMSDSELGRRIHRVRVVARATAKDKLRLIEALREAGHVVAMTGDGVNDAPAIKAANIGIAMGQSGTDVTREAADMVLADDNYATIVGAIEEGRKIYSNIKRFIVFLFAANAGLVLAVFVSAMLGWPPILTPTQILWINLITNGLPALALGMEPKHPDPMARPPREADAPLLNRRDVIWLGSYGTWMAVLGLGLFGWYRAQAGGHMEAHQLETARTMTFTVLAFSPLFHALNSRSRSRSAFALGIFSNWRLWSAFAVAVGLQAMAIYVPVLERVFGTEPLSLRQVGLALALSATVWGVGELHKAVLAAKRRVKGEEAPLSR